MRMLTCFSVVCEEASGQRTDPLHRSVRAAVPWPGVPQTVRV